MKKRKEILLLFLLIIAAGFLRFWGIIHGSFAFTFDVGRDLLAVRDLVYFHKISLLGPTSGQMGIFYGPWWYWFLAIPFFLFNGNPTGIVSFIAILGIVAVVLAFWWGRKFAGDVFAFSLAGILAVAPFFVSATTQLWSPDLLVLGTLVLIILLSKIERLNKKQLIIFGFLLAMLTEMEIVFGIIFILAVFLGFIFWERTIIFSGKIAAILCGIFLVELPRLIFELRHNFLQTRVLYTILPSKENYAYHLDTRVGIIWEKWLPVMPNNNTFIALILMVMIIFLVLLAFKKKQPQEKTFYLQLLTIAVVFIVITILYPRQFWEYYLLGLPVVFAVFVALAFSRLAHILSRPTMLVILIVYLVLLSGPNVLAASYKEPNFIGNAAVYRNQLSAIDYVYQQAGGHNFNYIAYTPPQIEYTWRYLFWWYGRKKYGFEPVQKRQERFYVIIEPDPGYERRITMWLEVRKNDGKIVKEETLPSGIMVQTRVRPKE